MANQNNQTTNQKNNRTQIPEPDLRLTIQRTAKQTVKGARVQQKQPQKRFAKDTVVKTHSVATDSKTCSKRISSHPSVRHAIYIVAKKTKKIAFAIHYRLTPLTSTTIPAVHCIVAVRGFSKKSRISSTHPPSGSAGYHRLRKKDIRSMCAGFAAHARGSRGAPFGEGTLSPLRRYLKPLPKGGGGTGGGVNEEPKPP